MKFTNEKDKAVWLDAMKLDIMSSEESDMDEEEEVLIIHPLEWRSDKLERMFLILDNEITKSKSPQAQRQMKRRVVGDKSQRPVPLIADTESLKWIAKK